MSQLLQKFGSSQVVFWIGFVAGCLFWWFQNKFRQALPVIRSRISALIRTMRQGVIANTIAHLKNDMLRLAQGSHLAAPLFSLDEILVKPRLLNLPMEFVAVNKNGEDDEPKAAIPYMPDWPGMAAAYHEPTLSLPEALSKGINLVLIGVPGSGKTTALAYLTSAVVRQSEEAGSLKDFLPVFIHVSDLPWIPGMTTDPLDSLVEAISVHASPLTLPRLKTVLRANVEQGKLLLLLDGFDELAPEDAGGQFDFLISFVHTYPTSRVVVAASLEYFDGLTAEGFVPVGLAAWDDHQKEQFTHGWGELWKYYIQRQALEGTEQVDNLLLNNWLEPQLANNTPLEVTLKTWAAYAGDTRGPTSPDAIESYLLRLENSIPNARPVLQKLALQMVIEQHPAVELKAAEKWMLDISHGEDQPDPGLDLTSPEADDKTPAVPDMAEPGESEVFAADKVTEADKPTVKMNLSVQKVLSDLISSGLLVARQNQQVCFAHPVLLAYLASLAIGESGDYDCLKNATDGINTRLAARYVLAGSDQPQLVEPLLNATGDPLHRKLFTAAGFISDALPAAPWRHKVMHRLAMMVQNDHLAFGLRARAICALVASGDPGVAVLFRQLLTHPEESVRHLAILGSGMLRDGKNVPDLVSLLDDPSPDIRVAVMPALAAIGTKAAIEAILQTLKQGTEEQRKAAAEALAGFPEEGLPALKQGSQDEDILVRRAVVFGLVRVDQPWASDLLQKMQIEDGQWVVRSAAALAVEEHQAPNIHLPERLPALNETPWLIAYAGRHGMGISPGKSAQKLVHQALKDGTLDEQGCVLNYLTILPDEETIPQLYDLLYNGSGKLKEAACDALWHLAATGARLPSPDQFGLG